MKNILKLFIILLEIIISGCARHQSIDNELDVSYPTVTRNGTQIENIPCDLSETAWWEKLKDPILNRLIRQSLKSNNQIQEAQANILQAQAELMKARYAWVPTLTGKLSGFLARTWDTNINPEGVLARNPIFSNAGNLGFQGYYSGFVPTYSFNILSNINNIKYARASLNVKSATYQATKLSIIGQMSGSYFMLLSQRKQFALQAQLINDLKKLRRIEFIRFSHGVNNIINTINYDQEIAENKQQLINLKNSISKTENAIQLLLNRNPNSVKTAKDISEKNIKKITIKHLTSGMLKNRPDVIIGVENLKMADAKLGSSYAAFFPNISLSGFTGGTSLELRHLLSISAGLWLVQGLASLKVLDPASYQEIKAAKASRTAALYNYLQTLRSAFADVDNSLTSLQNATRVYLQALSAYHAALKNYQVSIAQYQGGNADERTPLNAKLTLDKAELSLTVQKAQQLDSLVQVYEAIGAGYNLSYTSQDIHCG